MSGFLAGLTGSNDKDDKDKKKKKDKDDDDEEGGKKKKKKGEDDGGDEEDNGDENSEGEDDDNQENDVERLYKVQLSHIKFKNQSRHPLNAFLRFTVGSEKPRPNESDKERRKREQGAFVAKTPTRNFLRQDKTCTYDSRFDGVWRGTEKELKRLDLLVEAYDKLGFISSELEGKARIPLLDVATGSVEIELKLQNKSARLSGLVSFFLYFQEVRLFHMHFNNWIASNLQISNPSPSTYLSATIKRSHVANVKVRASKKVPGFVQKSNKVAFKIHRAIPGHKVIDYPAQLTAKSAESLRVYTPAKSTGLVHVRSVRTATVHGTLFPDWSQEATSFNGAIQYTGAMYDINREILQLRLYNTKGEKKKGTLVGRKDIPLRSVFGSDLNGSISAQLLSTKSKSGSPEQMGRVEGQVELIPQPNPLRHTQHGDGFTVERGATYLLVKIEEAHIRYDAALVETSKTAKNGSKTRSSAYFQVEWGTFLQQTKTIYGDTESKINADILFPLDTLDTTRAAMEARGNLTITCWSKEHNIRLGRAQLPLHLITDSPHEKPLGSRVFRGTLSLNEPDTTNGTKGSEGSVSILAYFKPDIEDEDDAINLLAQAAQGKESGGKSAMPGSSIGSLKKKNLFYFYSDKFPAPGMKIKGSLSKAKAKEQDAWKNMWQTQYNTWQATIGSKGVAIPAFIQDAEHQDVFLPSLLAELRYPRLGIDGKHERWRANEFEFQQDIPELLARVVQLITWKKNRYIIESGASDLTSSTRQLPSDFITSRQGDALDHSILLANFLMGMRGRHFHDVFVCIGCTRKGSQHAWVMTREFDGSVIFWELTARKVEHIKVVLPRRWKGKQSKRKEAAAAAAMENENASGDEDMDDPAEKEKVEMSKIRQRKKEKRNRQRSKGEPKMEEGEEGDMSIREKIASGKAKGKAGDAISAEERKNHEKEDGKIAQKVKRRLIKSRMKMIDEKATCRSLAQDEDNAIDELRSMSIQDFGLGRIVNTEASEKVVVEEKQGPVVAGVGVPYKSLQVIFDDKNIYGNVGSSYPGLCTFDVTEKSDWLPFLDTDFDEAVPPCPYSAPTIKPSPSQIAASKAADINAAISDQLRTFRRHQGFPTSMFADTSPIVSAMKEILQIHELEFCAGPKTRETLKLRLDHCRTRLECMIPEGMVFEGSPMWFTGEIGGTDAFNMVNSKGGASILPREDASPGGAHERFALAIHVAPYPLPVMAVWVFLAAIRQGSSAAPKTLEDPASSTGSGTGGANDKPTKNSNDTAKHDVDNAVSAA